MSLEDIAKEIGVAIGTRLHPRPAAQVHGGFINDCYQWQGEAASIFVKVATADRHATFLSEVAGLEELRLAAAVRVPLVLGVGESAGSSWLALEWIRFAQPSPASEAALGEQLARQHRCLRDKFGWTGDNTIGSTPQPNGWYEDWVAFFRDRRLRYQLDLARRNGHGGRLQRRGAELLERMQSLYAGYRPVASLLHGDLWGGNWASDDHGRPIIFDPAVYYGDREADLAMTHLFGGFGASFYRAYESAWALDSGARDRRALYNLYHVLNHLNLFGGRYLVQALSLIDGLLAEVGH